MPVQAPPARRRAAAGRRPAALFMSIFFLLVFISISSLWIDPATPFSSPEEEKDLSDAGGGGGGRRRRRCAKVEEMGDELAGGSGRESLRVRELIRRHFDVHGAATVRELPSHEFCGKGFVIGKSSEAGFGNEMYKILTAAALSIMLNRSLIIGKTRGLYPFEDYISYTNHSFTMREVKHLWKKHNCSGNFGRNLIMRVDNFEQPAQTNVLCSNWKLWKQPIIWFQGTNDASAAQFFLKNIHLEMEEAAAILFGKSAPIRLRPNTFGELMRAVISPSQAIEDIINGVLNGGSPDVALHMRMLTNKSVRALQAALKCTKNALQGYHSVARPQVVVVSDTPSLIGDIAPDLAELSEVIHFRHELFDGSRLFSGYNDDQQKTFRAKDWGPAPRWAAFVDFFLASRAKRAVITGAHRRVGTTYVQLIAALATANRQEEQLSGNWTFSLFSSFQSNLLTNGLASQTGWGHVWNRFAGPLSCHNQPDQCAHTPLLPPAWWDGRWQSPLPHDVQRLQAFGIQLSGEGEVLADSLLSFCQSRKEHVKTFRIDGPDRNSKFSGIT